MWGETHGKSQTIICNLLWSLRNLLLLGALFSHTGPNKHFHSTAQSPWVTKAHTNVKSSFPAIVSMLTQSTVINQNLTQEGQVQEHLPGIPPHRLPGLLPHLAPPRVPCLLQGQSIGLDGDYCSQAAPEVTEVTWGLKIIGKDPFIQI